jgi:5'-3' exonuclease
MCSAVIVSNWQKPDITDLHEQIFCKIIEHTMTQIVEICKPNNLLYIAIDGVAPLAKIQQQRKRRYMTAYRNKAILKWKEKHNISTTNWDSNIITPGTSFMMELDKYLESYFKDKKFSFEVVVSGSEQKGEGEHKIFNYIKESKKHDGIDVIYGLDADLIMLCLTCDQSNLYLMREQNLIDDSNNDTSFKFLEIDGLRIAVAQYMMTQQSSAFMLDYVAICLFLGNDFLPSISFLKIKNKGVQILIDIYKQTHFDMPNDTFIIEKKGKYSINKTFLLKFLENLAQIEDREMLRIHTEWANNKIPSLRQSNSLLDSFVESLESYPHTSPRKTEILKSIDIMNPKWRNFYYETIFNNHDTTFINTIASTYISGIDWVVDYYMNKTHNNKWMYDYGYAPSINDIYMTLYTNMYSSQSQQSSSVPYPDIELHSNAQLLMVIPPSSFNILPCNLQKLVKNTLISYLFPENFQIEVYLKTFLWECCPKLPSIKVREVMSIVTSNSNM